MEVHLIPGLGADHRVFDRLLLDHPGRHAHDWPVMPEGSSLADFAQVLAQRVDASRPHLLIGMSMGGMVAQEMAAITKPARVAIISSWKGPHEMPLPIRTLRGTHPERLLTKAMLHRMMVMIRWQMGVGGTDAAPLLESFMENSNIEQLKIQIAAVLDWEGPAQAISGLIHIHGDNDLLMPIWAIKDPKVVKGGTHFAVYSKALQVERLLRECLPEL